MQRFPQENKQRDSLCHPILRRIPAQGSLKVPKPCSALPWYFTGTTQAWRRPWRSLRYEYVLYLMPIPIFQHHKTVPDCSFSSPKNGLTQSPACIFQLRQNTHLMYSFARAVSVHLNPSPILLQFISRGTKAHGHRSITPTIKSHLSDRLGGSWTTGQILFN